MSETKTCKCKYCLHETREISETDDFVVDKDGEYRHADCYKAEDDILNIIDLWSKRIDKDVSFSYLRKELNRLIYTERNPSGYVLFCAKRGANSGRLHYVPGLKYFVNNGEVKKAYEALLIKQHKFVVTEDDSREPKFSGVNKPTGFGGIFGGKQ